MPDLSEGLDKTSYNKNYYSFDVMLGCVSCFKFMSLFYKIYFEQSGLDIFMIDWESPKLY